MLTLVTALTIQTCKDISCEVSSRGGKWSAWVVANNNTPLIHTDYVCNTEEDAKIFGAKIIDEIKKMDLTKDKDLEYNI